MIDHAHPQPECGKYQANQFAGDSPAFKRDPKLGIAVQPLTPALAQQLGDQLAIPIALGQLGYVLLARGDRAVAHRVLREGLIRWRELGDNGGIVHCIEGLAAVAVVNSRAEQAVRLWAGALRVRAA